MKEKINNLDISSILFLQLFSCSLGIAPYITIKITGIDAYISIIIGTIIGIIPILILIYIFNYEIDKPIHVKTKIIYGKTLGTIINIILTIIYIILTLTMLFNTSNFIISQYLTNTSITLVTLILGITVYHTVSKGITTISKISIIYTIIILSLLILGIIGIIPEIKLDNLKPILENGIKPPFLAALIYTLLLTSPAYSFLIIPKSIIENNKKTTKYLLITYMITSLAIFLICIISSSCLGRYLIKIYQYPVYITLKKISIFSFIDRIENFLSLQWILSSFISLTIYIYNIKENINKKNNPLLNLILIITIILISTKIFKNNTNFNHYLDSIYPYILIIQLVIYTIISITIFIKKSIKNKKNKYNNNTVAIKLLFT